MASEPASTMCRNVTGASPIHCYLVTMRFIYCGQCSFEKVSLAMIDTVRGLVLGSINKRPNYMRKPCSINISQIGIDKAKGYNRCHCNVGTRLQ